MSDDAESPRRGEAVVVFALFAAVYAATASRHMLGGDAGEFATIYADGGTAHPPGYPLYSIYLRAFSWLPVDSPAHGAALATSLLGSAAAALLYAAARAWGCDRLESTFAVVATGLAPHVWLYHTSPEVFALNNAIAAAICWAAAPGAPVRGPSRVALLGLLAGLGLSNHLTIVLIAPIGLWGVYRGVLETDGDPIAALGAGSGSLMLGMTPYAYLPFVAVFETGWHWADPETIGATVEIFLRRDYGTFQMTANESSAEPIRQLGLFAKTVPLDLFLVPVLVAVAGFAKHVADGVRNAWDPRLSYVVALGLSIALSGPLFVCMLTIDPEGVGTVLLRRFHLLPEVQLGLLSAVGAAAFRPVRPSRGLAVLLVAALAVAALPRIWSAGQTHHSAAVEEYVRDTFGTLPDDAVVLGTGDHNFFGALYLQRGLDQRNDVDYVDAFLLAHRWYVERVDASLEADLAHTGSSIDTDAVLATLLETGRPVFVTGAFTDGLLEEWRGVPRGTTIRIHGRDRPAPTPLEVYRRNEQLYETFEITLPAHADEHSWRRLVLEDYAATWDRIAGALRRTGSPELARRAERRASAFRPWNTSTSR